MSSNYLLQYLIQEEINEGICFATETEEEVFHTFLGEVNSSCGTDYHFLAEIALLRIEGSGNIVAKYIPQIVSETIRSYMMGHMVDDRIKNCGEILYEMYLHFKLSSDYIAERGKPSPMHIYTRYDDCFRKLKPKELKTKLIELISSPRDAFYLPFTMKMLASWREEKVKYLLEDYLDGGIVTYQSVGLPENAQDYFPSLQSIQRELRFSAIAGLQYFPSDEVRQLIYPYTNDIDNDICRAAISAIGKIEHSLHKH